MAFYLLAIWRHRTSKQSDVVIPKTRLLMAFLIVCANFIWISISDSMHMPDYLTFGVALGLTLLIWLSFYVKKAA
jgi:hypothetical protein